MGLGGVICCCFYVAPVGAGLWKVVKSQAAPSLCTVLYTCYFVSAVVVQLGNMGQSPDFFLTENSSIFFIDPIQNERWGVVFLVWFLFCTWLGDANWSVVYLRD